MIFKKQILFLFSLFVVQFVTAQGGAAIKATVDKNKILIGEPIQLTVEAYLSPESAKKFIEIDSIKHFELLEKPVIDTIEKEGGLNIKGVYKITSFDSGHWVIPSFSLSKNVKSDTIPVDVVFSDFDPQQEYHDIKDILKADAADTKKDWWLYAAGGALLLVLLLFYLLKKKKPVPASVPKTIFNPYEEAMKQLEQLQREKPEAKQYYSGLTDIFRLYIYRKKGILSLQKTTDDLIIQLNSLNINKEQFGKLSQSLRLSDFVKFAKFIPTGDDDKKAFEEIRSSIITIEKTEAKAPL
jgi:LPXTG-motif cell wall-anchored protein